MMWKNGLHSERPHYRIANRSCGVLRLYAGIFVSLSLALAALPATGAEERGFLGFSVQVDAEGFFLNPTLKSAVIASVAAGSPAASAGIAPQDRIIEVEGQAVAGAKGKDLGALSIRHLANRFGLSSSARVGKNTRSRWWP